MEKRFQLPRYQLLNSTISSCNNGPPSPGLKIRPGAVWLNGKSAAPQESLFRWHPRCAWLPGTTRVSAAKYFVFLSIFLQGEKKKGWLLRISHCVSSELATGVLLRQCERFWTRNSSFVLFFLNFLELKEIFSIWDWLNPQIWNQIGRAHVWTPVT